MHLVAIAKTMSCTSTLKKKGYRVTLQRGMILDVLHSSGGHFTADAILSQVQARAPEVNKSTIYRTLDLLEELGLVVKSEHEGRFIYHHVDECGHHHLSCTKCGKTIDCDPDLLKPLEASLMKQFGFEADLRHIVIHGTCKSCRKG